ncbi:MAG: M28 family peptidase [Armatimonadetes bacterium]|nr:M28 family peptidase [Armatimonadota bacterium]
MLGSGLAAAAGSARSFQQADAARPFDKQRAFQHLEKQVGFGPRVPNQPGHRACRDYLVETLRPLASRVELQEFTFPLGGDSLSMANVIARIASRRDRGGVLLCAHWDTRPTADYERDRERRRMPIPGANDGASGVAVLLEVARVLKRTPPPVPVMIVFFDGEDYGPGLDRMFLGSRYFAANLPRDVPRQGILLDMVGDKDLRIPQEANSRAAAGAVLREVYAIASRLGYGAQFPARPGQAIEDDHIPLHERGLQVIDLIDFNYGPGHSWWHTLQDTPDKCSPESLKAVGDVVLEWVRTRR